MVADLITISDYPQRGDLFSARIATPAAGDYVSAISVDDRVLLYVGFEAAGEMIISRQTADDWEILARCAAPATDVTLRILFDDAACTISIADHELRVPADCRRIWRVIGHGDWQNSALLLAGRDEAARLVLHGLPPEPVADRARQPDLVFDVGMHRGTDTAFYLAKGFRVVAFEANPLLCTAAARRFKDEIARGELRIVNIGIGPQAGRLPFYVNEENSEWSSLDPDIAARGRCSEITVPVHPMTEIVAAFGTPHYIKADIEGFDHHAIIPLAQARDKPASMSYENAGEDVFQILVANGYRAFQLVNQFHVGSMRCPQPSREGKTIDWVFPPGSSGPFGHDLPDAWLDATAMAARLAQYTAQRQADLAAGRLDWFDLHARLDAP